MALLKADYSSPGEAGKRGFEDLDCFKLALDVIVSAHAFARKLPPEEKFDMAAQVRGSAKSITANIAEGYGRYHYLDSLKFYSNARGSLNETLSHFINARALNYIDQVYFEELYHLCRQTEKILNGYMTYIRKQRAGDDERSNRTLRDGSGEYRVDDDADISWPQDEQQIG